MKASRSTKGAGGPMLTNVTAARAVLASVVVFAAPHVLACNALTAAAAQDPMKCERDPKCVGHEEKSKDCVTTCVDDPECIDRCRQITGQR